MSSRDAGDFPGVDSSITNYYPSLLFSRHRHKLASINVGYKTYTLDKKFTLIGVCFQGVDGKAMTINEAFPMSEGMTKAITSTAADNIQVMGEDGQYTIYSLFNGQYGKVNNPSYKMELDGKWVRAAGQECTDTVSPGQAFWYVSKTAATTPHTITVAGQVLMTSSSSPKDFTGTYNLYANPYACEVPLNGGLSISGSIKAMTSTAADNIQVMGDNGQYTIYFLSNGQYGKVNNPSYKQELDGSWLRSAGQACDDKIPAGASFWYVSRSEEGNISIANPLVNND
ncbi:MAG: hypothetical protein IJI36_17600 [Kiritimatiellae bacterium]|nr:hypothetical protein [Kiritimatiellia bacterium]